MKALVIALNARYTHSSLAIRYLRNALEDASAASGLALSVELRDYHITQPRLEIVRDIAAAEPDLLFFSTYIWNAELVGAVLPDVKALLPGCGIVLGGPEAGHDAAAWLAAHSEVDLVVRGPGESAAGILAAAGFRLDSFPGRTLVAPPVAFSSVPFPYREADFLALEKRYLYYESSRGCPFHCSYCLSSREDQALDEKDAATVMGEIGEMMAHAPYLIKFVDRTFNVHPERARELWRTLILRFADAGTRFHFEVHPALLAEDDFSILANAPEGLFQFEIGVQTVHARTRSAIHRNGDWDRERAAIQRLVALGTVHMHLDLIAGLPGEGMNELRCSFDEVMSLGVQQLQLGFLKGLPGTELREDASGFGAIFQKMPPYEVLETDALSSADLAELKRIEELVDGIANSGRFGKAMGTAAGSLGGWFAAYRDLSAYCARTGFDVRTRNGEKLGALLDSWKDGHGEGGGPVSPPQPE
ncbi:MAG: DUF4080 domain-containing protein [Spirochaetales bacterium]|nr:MAG: DUF4080 domain-containing protein [Spirochaetales bacterium]